jgi:hypothetical protein
MRLLLRAPGRAGLHIPHPDDTARPLCGLGIASTAWEVIQAKEPTCTACRRRMKMLRQAGMWVKREAVKPRQNQVRGIERAPSGARHGIVEGNVGMDRESVQWLTEVGAPPGQRSGERPCCQCGERFWSSDRRAVQCCERCRRRILESDAASFEGEWA